MKRKKLRSLVVVFAVALIVGCIGTTVHAATSVWKEAPARYYDSSVTYRNAQWDGYSFEIDKLCKKGKDKDQKSYKKLNMLLVVTNPKMFLRYNGTGQEKNQWSFTANKNKEYAYIFVDKNGTVGAQKTGLNVMIKGYDGKNMNTKIAHTIY